ncbi:MAG: FAD-dependent oxidoreductase [Longimicrobiaceae bacterium]
MARVVVLGGGVGGMSAAHELAERGFEVVVLERRAIPGGKARSIPVAPVGSGLWAAEARHPHEAPGDAVDWVPGEHGFRLFPGFYKHVVDTMGRSPASGRGSVADHLVATTRVGITQYGRPGLTFPARFPRTPGDAVSVLGALLAAFSPVTELTPEELAHFGGRMWQILTSCAERRVAEYEKIAWWEFIDAESRSAAYRKFLASGITRSLVAAKAHKASTRTIGDIFIQLALTILDPTAETTDRVLDGPTNDVWIEPWLRCLESLGVGYLWTAEVRQIRCVGDRITGVLVERDGRMEVVEGDHYVCALPVERIAPLLTPSLLGADPGLEAIRPLARNVDWMNGVQFYLRRDVPMIHGHVIHIDTEWALTSISQVRFWRPGTLRRYGDPEIHGILSVDVSDWEAPARDGRCANQFTREGVCKEVWRQLQQSVNVGGETVLRDEDLCGWFLDPDIDLDPGQPGQLANAEPLLVNLADTWRLRPEAVTRIPNFFLASDYVRTYTDLATMEAANEAARRAVNGVLDAAGHVGSRCDVWPLEEPAVLAPLRQYDAARFAAGLPWDASLLDVAAAGLSAAGPLLAPLPALIAAVQPVATPALRSAQEAVDAVEGALPIEAVEAATLHAAAALRDAALPLFRTGTSVEPESDTQAGPPGFAERLEWYRSQTLGRLEDAVPAKEPQRHLYGPIREFVTRPGKGLRPALCIATCRASGGRTADALTSAAGLELLHGAFLVHDDIEDGSESRRGRPTLHRTVGVPLAVNVGDAMNTLAMGLFRRNVGGLGPEAALRIFDEVDHMLLESLEGQAMELGWVRENDCRVGIDDYLRLVLKKTAWYSFIHPMRIGARVARPRDEELDRFNAFGFLLGAAFQIQDDVLNLVGDASRYGKEIGGDLWEGKRTLVLAHAFSRSSPAGRARLEAFFARPRERRLPRQMFEIQELLTQSGSIAWARQAALALARAAQEALPTAFADAREGPDLAFIRSLVDYLVDRDV